MLWFKKDRRNQVAEDAASTAQVELAVKLDEQIFASKLQQLLDAIDENGGLDRYIEALNNKQALFGAALSSGAIDSLDEHGFDVLLETVFPARRKLAPLLKAMAHNERVSVLRDLLHGSDADVDQRLVRFVDVLAGDERKARRAAWDFAAELLHFSQPELYPLMTRWVWDARVQSGAMREFIRGNDSQAEIAIGNGVADFEAGRRWFAEQISAQGFYRDMPQLINLVLAQAYADYVLAMSNGMGMMGSEFGAKMEPIEWVGKLLGIEHARLSGKSRIKQVSVH